MTSLFEAVNATATTTNGMATQHTSMNKCVDLFFLAGASRGKNIIPEFVAAYAENPEVAVRIAQWVRDVRGGAGERQLFRDLVTYLIKHEVNTASRLVKNVAEIGRWDDMLIFIGTYLQAVALDEIKSALLAENALCAKWMPRPTGKHKQVANIIRKHMGMTPKAYRQLLSTLSNTVEQQMCAGEWDSIDFEKVPSVAAARYQKAFGRNAEAHYAKYLDKLEKGEAKINAGAVYPYDVMTALKCGEEKAANAQWAALPDYLEGSEERILGVVDVSGSMCSSAGNSSTVSCMDVAISLGLYLSERMEGAFKDQFMTFSSRPEMVKVSGTLQQRYAQMSQSDWDMDTNLEAVFDTLLKAATQSNVSENDMPTKVLIFSDMQFNQAILPHGTPSRYSWGRQPVEYNPPAMTMIEQQYADAGYKMPQIVFWNINAQPGQVPVSADKSGAALVSGFSPAILTSILGDDTFTPEGIMLETVMVERYDF